MTAASRVVLVPPEAWDEDRIVKAARDLARPSSALRPGDEVGGLVVLRVEPGADLAPDASTVFEVRGGPRVTSGPVHLAVLLDASESMGLPWSADHTRLEAARESLLDSLRGARERLSGASIFVFAKDVRLATGPLTAEALPRVGLEPLTPKGPARTGAALDAALAHLAGQSEPPEQAVLLLTDGPGAGLAPAAARAARLRIPIHVVTFAPTLDPELARVASTTGGLAQQASLPLGFDLPPRSASP